MKETLIRAIPLDFPLGELKPGESAAIPRGDVAFPRELQSTWELITHWGSSLPPEGPSFFLIHEKRWSTIAWVDSTHLRGVSFLSTDFGRYFAADPFRVWDRFAHKPEVSSLAEGTLRVEPEWSQPPSLDTFQNWLKSDDSALLLGGAQALMDGAKIHLDRDGNEWEVARRLWNLVPLSLRLEKRLVVNDPEKRINADLKVSRTPGDPDAWTSQRLGDYPEGRYEFGLQTAIDNGDEAAIHGYLARRSPKQVMMLAALLLGGFVLIGLIMGW